MAAISLAPAGALLSIGNVTSRASCSAQRLLCQPCVASYDALVLARAMALLVMVVFRASVELMVVAALFFGMVMDFVFEYVAATRPESSGERVSDCSRAVVPVGRVVTGLHEKSHHTDLRP